MEVTTLGTVARQVRVLKFFVGSATNTMFLYNISNLLSLMLLVQSCQGSYGRVTAACHPRFAAPLTLLSYGLEAVQAAQQVSFNLDIIAVIIYHRAFL